MSELPVSLARTPLLDRWLSIGSDGSVTLRTGKVEIGQGIYTALALIVADELDVDPERVRVITAATGVTPNEMITAGSMSVEHSGAALRQAAATARQLMLAAAADELGVDVEVLTVDDGVISSPGLNAASSYWAVQGGKPFDVTIEQAAEEKPPEAYRYVGKHAATRVDLEAKVRGEPVFLHDLEFPDMLHARIIRPPAPKQRLVSLDVDVGADVELICDGSFVAVASADEHRAVRAAAAVELAASWTGDPNLSVTWPLSQHMKSHEAATLPLRDGVPEQVEPRQLLDPENARRASYSRPFLMHGSIGPSAAAAHWSQADGELTVWSASQGIEPLRLTLADALALEPTAVQVIYRQGAGCYGHNGADDASLDAALCAMQQPGRHVLVKWTRNQEHLWEPYGPAMYLELAANLDGAGRINDWRHDVWSYSHSGRPFPGRDGINLIAAWHRADAREQSLPRPARTPEVGIHRNAAPIYAFPRTEVVKRFVADAPLRTSSLRSLGAHANVFAIESFMDELAQHVGTDPVQFRLEHLDDPRARAVLETAVGSAGGLGEGASRGRGVALARYKNRQCWAAVVAEVEVDLDRAAVAVAKLWIAADAGCIVDRDGLVNQLEGGAVQAVSWTLKEAVQFDASGVQSVDWETYPILRFDEVPEVTTTLIDRPREPSLGAGEACQGPTSAAIANAVARATGIRVRDLPLSSAALRAAAAR